MTACGDVTRVSFPRNYVAICFRLLWLSSGHVVVWLQWLRVTTACGDVKVRFGLPLTSRFLWLAALSKRNIRRWHVKIVLHVEFSTLRPTGNTLLRSCSASQLHTTPFYPLCTYESYWYTTIFTSPVLLSVTLKSTLIRMWTHIPCHSQHTQWSHSNNGTLNKRIR